MIRRKVKSFELVMISGMLIFLAYVHLLQAISARRGARMAICAANLKQIGLAVHMYCQDYDNWLPPAYCQFCDKYWVEILEPYIFKSISSKQKQNPLICPSDKNHIWRGTNYICNGYYGFFSTSGYLKNLAYKPRKLSDFKHPEDSLLLMDGKPDVSPVFTKSNYVFCIDLRHKDMEGINFLYVLYVDGSIMGIRNKKGINFLFTENQLYGY